MTYSEHELEFTFAKNDASGVERGVGGRGAGTDRGERERPQPART